MESTSYFCQYGVIVLFYSAISFLVGSLLKSSLQHRGISYWRAIRRKQPPNSQATEYSGVFPPSQRHLLPHSASGDEASSATNKEVSRNPELLLGLETDYRLASPEQFIYSGFTVGEIRSLGSFPDYAALCEVPLPIPLEDFDISTTRPRPYRPLRWPYHQTMAIQRLEPDYWIELESTYQEQVKLRKAIVQENTKDVLQALPGSELACRELMEMVVQFLCARYPKHFTLEGTTLVNKILGTEHDVSNTEPLQILLDNVPEDFAIMIRDPKTGTYKFRAGLICASTGWNLGGKIGKGLADIHDPVPDYRSRMQLSMDRFFTKFPASKPVQRGAWGFEVGQHLYTPPGNSKLRDLETQDPGLQPDDLLFRVDWQTLRRLPLSGAIVFNFKAFFTPVTDLKHEPYIPSLCLKVLYDSKENLREYKQVHHTKHVLWPLLSGYERFQKENDMMEDGWEPRTLEESPFFPGWQSKQ